MPIRRGTKTAAVLRAQTIGAVVVDGRGVTSERTGISATEAWRRFDAERRMRIVPDGDTYVLFTTATRPMIELRLKTLWEAVCTVCVVAMSSNVPIDECHNCEATALVHDGDPTFEMWKSQATTPPPQIPIGHRRRLAVDYVRADRQGQTNELASIGHQIGHQLGAYIDQVATEMAARYDGFRKTASDNYRTVLLQWITEFLPDNDPTLFDKVVRAILGDKID